MTPQTPNSDIASLPGSTGDPLAGNQPLTPDQQLQQLLQYFEDNYPETFASLTTDEGAAYKNGGQGAAVPTELKERTERLWSKVPDLISHASLLVLGAGLDHRMPHVSHITASGPGVDALPEELAQQLPEGVAGQVITPSEPTGAVAISLHGGPGWFGDGLSHDQLWLPLFAALAEASGTTVYDLTYALPGYGSWAAAQEAVAATHAAIAAHLGKQGGDVGVITFGSGLVAAAEVLAEAGWALIMTPRIPAGFATPNPVPRRTLVSVMSDDSRATPLPEARDYFAQWGNEVQWQEFVGEHIIAPPEQWRLRIDAAAEWLQAGQ